MNFGRSKAFAFACLASIGLLRSENFTNLSGVIVDASASSVPGALVTVTNEDTGFRRVTLSESDGCYVVSSLEPGSYKITVRKSGFRTVIRFGVKLTADQPARVDFRLAVGSILESITVEGTAPLLDSEDASVGTVIGHDEEEHLPLSGRGASGLLELAPGVVITPATHGEAGQFTVNGQRPNTNYFTVDGASANNGVSGGGLPAQSTGGTLPNLTAFGSLDSLVSLDALQEMRIQTSSSVPEFGRLPGAQVSLTSRSGSNQFHGSMQYGFRDQDLDANNWFANESGEGRATLHLNDISAGLGGPVWRNHTFFFVSYEALRLLQPFVWLEPVPSLATRQSTAVYGQPILNLFPQPTGPDFGDGLALWSGQVSRPSRLDEGAVRLDQALGSRLTLFTRYSESPSSTQFGTNSVNALSLGARSITLGLNLRARADLIFDLRLNYSKSTASSVWQQSPPLAPCALDNLLDHTFSETNTCDYLIRLTLAGAGEVVEGPEGNRGQTQYQAAQTGNWNVRSHAIQFGVDYRRLSAVRQDAATLFSLLADNVSDLTNTNDLWKAESPPQDLTARVQETSLFAADTWQVMPRLTATYGVRWELSPGPTPGTPANYFNPSTGVLEQAQQPLWHSSYGNIGPRFGIAYQLTKQGSTVIRGGGGFYYDSSLSLATDLVNDGPLSVSMYGTSQNAPLYSTLLEFGFLPNLRLPLVRQWNVSVEHAFGDHDVLSVSYVGSSGRDLVRREVGGTGSTDSTLLALATNDGSSIYHSLQVQYRHRLAHGFQALASYAWSHSIDNSSSDSALFWAGDSLTPRDDRASSDFDVRQIVTAGFSYDFSSLSRSRWIRGWTLDGMFRARTGFPVNLLDVEQYMGLPFADVFRPNYVGGQPLWVYSASLPGGRALNPAAFVAAPADVQGNLGRNAITGFGMNQLDLSLRREWVFREHRALQVRVEAFNALNHANFADPIPYLSSPLFGQSSSMLNMMLGTGSPGSGLAPIFQSGGPRSLQVMLQFRF
jgi:hypothetical protein